MSRRREGALANEDLQNVAKEREALRDAQQKADLEVILGTPPGRRFLYRLIFEIAGTESLSYTGNAETYFREGRRDVGLTVRAEAQDNFPELYIRMVAEQMATRQEEVRRRKEERTPTEIDE